MSETPVSSNTFVLRTDQKDIVKVSEYPGWFLICLYAAILKHIEHTAMANVYLSFSPYISRLTRNDAGQRGQKHLVASSDCA